MNDSSQLPKRLPPANIEAEKAVLGGILFNPQALAEIVEIISEEDFFKDSHQIIFKSYKELSNEGVSIDLIALKDQLDKDGCLKKIGGSDYLASLLDETSAASNLEYYSRIIREKALLRRLIDRGEKIVLSGYAGEGDVKAILNDAEASIFELAQDKGSDRPRHVAEILKPTFEAIEKMSKRPEMITGVATGFEDLDEKTSGFQPGDMIVIAGRPSMGKTTFGLNIVQNMALKNQPALVFSLEMTKEQLVRRLLCSKAEIDGKRLQTGFIRGDEWTKLARAAAELSHIPLYIDDSPAISMFEMRSRARRQKSQTGLSVIMIDYLQLMQSRRRYESRQLEISEISRSLKFMAKELEVPVIALSQLSRAVETHSDKRPLLSDLRESGAIEQDADVVLMLYRPEYYNIEEIRINDNETIPSVGIAEVIIAKQRNGPVGSLFLAFRKNLLQFKDRAKSD